MTFWADICAENTQADQATWDAAPGNINLEYYASSTPVDKYMLKGFGDVIGNVWQHTETPIMPFKGFRVHRIYDDFSGVLLRFVTQSC